MCLFLPAEDTLPLGLGLVFVQQKQPSIYGSLIGVLDSIPVVVFQCRQLHQNRKACSDCPSLWLPAEQRMVPPSPPSKPSLFSLQPFGRPLLLICSMVSSQEDIFLPSQAWPMAKNVHSG